jgi:hypothetical protein
MNNARGRESVENARVYFETERPRGERTHRGECSRFISGSSPLSSQKTSLSGTASPRGTCGTKRASRAPRQYVTCAENTFCHVLQPISMTSQLGALDRNAKSSADSRGPGVDEKGPKIIWGRPGCFRPTPSNLVGTSTPFSIKLDGGHNSLGYHRDCFRGITLFLLHSDHRIASRSRPLFAATEVNMSSTRHSLEPIDVKEMDTTKHMEVADDFNWTPEEEKALVKKIDLFLLPTIWLMYLLSYMDRTKSVCPEVW